MRETIHSIDQFLSHFEKIKPIRQDEWQALCPAHSDHDPSLTISLKDQKILVHCHTGCAPNKILEAVNLTMADLFIGDSNRKNHSLNTPKEIVAEYSYQDLAGKELFQVVRFHPKSFAQRHKNGNGEYVWGLKGVTPVLYHLPEIAQAIKNGERIEIVEGERDVDNLRKLGYIATTNPMGAGKFRPEYADSLKGAKEVVIIPDADTVGRKHAWDVANSLYNAQIPVKIATIPDGSVKDISDWINIGAKKDDIDLLITSPPNWTPAVPQPIQKPAHYNLTDLGNAERLIDKYGEDLRFCQERNLWLIWRGTHWHWDLGAEIQRYAQLTARSIYTEAADEDNDDERKKLLDWAKASESNMRIKGMISQAESLAIIPLSDLDADRWLFNCKSGTIDLKTGLIREASRENYITMMAPVEYDPHTPAPLWTEFINQIMDNNNDLIAYLQRGIGYCLTGDTSEQVFFFCYGGGSNGKSTFLNTFMTIFGQYAAQINTRSVLSQNMVMSGGHTEDLANLAGKRLVVGTELPDDGSHLAVEKIKQMTGGERIRASHKYEREFEYDVTFKLWLNANHKPNINDTTFSIWRRVKLIPFNVTIPDENQDKKLLQKLHDEYPAILAWAVQGCIDWQDHTLLTPSIVQTATNTYRIEQDILAEFIQSCCFLDTHDDVIVSHKELYTAYTNWCEENSIDAITSRTFSKRLLEKTSIQKFTGHGQIKWRHIRLKLSTDQAQNVSTESDQKNSAQDNAQSTQCLLQLDEKSSISSTRTVDEKLSSTQKQNQNTGRVDEPMNTTGLLYIKEINKKFTQNTSPSSTLASKSGFFIYPDYVFEPDELTFDEKMEMLTDGCAMTVAQLKSFWKMKQCLQIPCTGGIITNLDEYLDNGIINIAHVGDIVDWIESIKEEKNEG